MMEYLTLRLTWDQAGLLDHLLMILQRENAAPAYANGIAELKQMLADAGFRRIDERGNPTL